jgi:hypothetical protein
MLILWDALHASLKAVIYVFYYKPWYMMLLYAKIYVYTMQGVNYYLTPINRKFQIID